MIGWRIGAAAAFLLAAGAAQAADFRINGVAFVSADIMDARALPVPGGPPIVMITFADAALPKLAEATGGGGDAADVPVTLDGRVLTRLVLRGPRQDPVLTIGGTKTLAEAEQVAREISGKPPLPESIEE